METSEERISGPCDDITELEVESITESEQLSIFTTCGRPSRNRLVPVVECWAELGANGNASLQHRSSGSRALATSPPGAIADLSLHATTVPQSIGSSLLVDSSGDQFIRAPHEPGRVQRPWTTEQATASGRLQLACNERAWSPAVQSQIPPRPFSGCSDPTFSRPRPRLPEGPPATDLGSRPTPSRGSATSVGLELRQGARLLAGVGRQAVRSAGVLLDLDLDDEHSTFLCQVCLENQLTSQRLVLKECQNPEHRCCATCTASFFRTRIEQGRVFELVCPSGAVDRRCKPSLIPSIDPASWNAGGTWLEEQQTATASHEEVEAVLADDQETLSKFKRFLRTKMDTSLRECPDCQHFCSPTFDVGVKEPRSEMQCDNCGCTFCYYHAAAHRGSSCEEYEVRLAAETQGICEALGTRDCPCCGRQTLKTGGCNHMTCQVCRSDWCWICGTALTARGPHGEDAVYWHYCDDNVDSGCRQFAEPGRHPDAEQVRLWRRGRRPGLLVRRLAAPARLVSVSLLVFSALVALVLWLVAYFSAIAIASIVEFVARAAATVCRACCFCSRGRSRSAAGEVGVADGEGTDIDVDKTEFSREDSESQLGKSQLLVKPTLYPCVAIGTVLFLVPFAVFCLAWAAVSLVAWIVLWPVSRLPLIRRCMPPVSRHNLRFLVSAPLRSVHQFGSSVFAQLADEAEGLERY